jgi:hypothetical protein
MAMDSTKEQINQVVMAMFHTVEVSIGTEKATLRELSRAERDALDKTNYKRNANGAFEDDAKGFLVPINPSQHAERWIAACITPAHTVEEIAKWPPPIVEELCEKAKKINNIETAEKTAKNS